MPKFRFLYAKEVRFWLST